MKGFIYIFVKSLSLTRVDSLRHTPSNYILHFV